MGIVNNFRNGVGAAVLAVASAFGVEGCGAKTELYVMERRPTSQEPTNPACPIVNEGPRCASTVQRLTQQDPFAGNPQRARFALLAAHPEFHIRPLVDGYFMHTNADFESTDRPTINNVTTFAESAGILAVGGVIGHSPFVLFYHTDSGALVYADFGTHNFIQSGSDLRMRYAPSDYDLFPVGQGLMSSYAMRRATDDSFLHLNAAGPINDCTELTTVTAMAIRNGVLYVVDGTTNAVFAYPGLPGFSQRTSQPGIYPAGESADLCR